MSKRFGKKRVPECECDYNFTCRACLFAAGPTGERFGVFAEVREPKTDAPDTPQGGGK